MPITRLLGSGVPSTTERTMPLSVASVAQANQERAKLTTHHDIKKKKIEGNELLPFHRFCDGRRFQSQLRYFFSLQWHFYPQGVPLIAWIGTKGDRVCHSPRYPPKPSQGEGGGWVALSLLWLLCGWKPRGC